MATPDSAQVQVGGGFNTARYKVTFLEDRLNFARTGAGSIGPLVVTMAVLVGYQVGDDLYGFVGVMVFSSLAALITGFIVLVLGMPRTDEPTSKRARGEKVPNNFEIPYREISTIELRDSLRGIARRSTKKLVIEAGARYTVDVRDKRSLRLLEELARKHSQSYLTSRQTSEPTPTERK
jgi:hypothetical protein